MTPLTSARRSLLRAEAHKLSPVVIVGDKGLTDEVLAEIDRSLKAHELIKVRAATDERDARAAWIEAICERLQAHAVQQIGKIFVIYRENPKEEKKARKELGPGPWPRARGARDDEQRSPRGDGKRSPPSDGKRTPRGDGKREARDDDSVKRTARPRSRTPSPRPASEPRRRRPRTSR